MARIRQQGSPRAPERTWQALPSAAAPCPASRQAPTQRPLSRAQPHSCGLSGAPRMASSYRASAALKSPSPSSRLAAAACAALQAAGAGRRGPGLKRMQKCRVAQPCLPAMRQAMRRAAASTRPPPRPPTLPPAAAPHPPHLAGVLRLCHGPLVVADARCRCRCRRSRLVTIAGGVEPGGGCCLGCCRSGARSRLAGGLHKELAHQPALAFRAALALLRRGGRARLLGCCRWLDGGRRLGLRPAACLALLALLQAFGCVAEQQHKRLSRQECSAHTLPIQGMTHGLAPACAAWSFAAAAARCCRSPPASGNQALPLALLGSSCCAPTPMLERWAASGRERKREGRGTAPRRAALCPPEPAAL